jgi:hypothetical protein
MDFYKYLHIHNIVIVITEMPGPPYRGSSATAVQSHVDPSMAPSLLILPFLEPRLAALETRGAHMLLSRFFETPPSMHIAASLLSRDDDSLLVRKISLISAAVMSRGALVNKTPVALLDIVLVGPGAVLLSVMIGAVV